MALSASTVWECRAAGAADTNGGGFVAGSGGTDRSQQNAAQVAVGGGVVTSSVTTNVITFTGGTYTVLAGDVGNIVQVISGTNTTPGFFQITSVTAGLNGTWTMDRNVVSAGTSTDLVANMGGALATLSKLISAWTIGGQQAWATGAFTSTATLTFAPGSIIPNGTNGVNRLRGYGSTRGDTGHATLTLQTNTGLTGINAIVNGFQVENFDVDCASLGTSTGISVTGQGSGVKNCKVANFTVKGIRNTASTSGISECEITGGTAAATSAIDTTSAYVTRCFVHDNACPGIVPTGSVPITWCLIANNSGATADGINTTYNCTILNNTIHGNGRDGVRMSAVHHLMPQQCKNNILSNNGGWGLNQTSTAIPANSDNDGNAFYSNTSGARSGLDSTAGNFGVSPYTNTHDVTLTVSPYVGGTTGTTANFALNNTAGGGAACRAAGSPGTWPGNTGTTGYLDMGAVQHQDAGTAGMLVHPGMSGGLRG